MGLSHPVGLPVFCDGLSGVLGPVWFSRPVELLVSGADPHDPC